MSTSSSSSASSFPPPELRPLLDEVTTLLKDRHESVSIAETACGGLLSSSILSTPGASKIFQGGLTLYTLPSRIAYAGWTQAHIDAYDGPTTEIVAGLASHVRGDLKSTYTVSESGTAGPTGSGAAPNRRPGYVALAVSCERGVFTRELNTGSADRTGNMVVFAVEALKLLKEVIVGEAKL